MRLLIILLSCILLVQSCKEYANNSKVVIVPKSDTIKINDTFEAELFIAHKDSFLPNFYIVNKEDTFLLPFDEVKNCAVFKAVGRKYGNSVYFGFVNYKNQEGTELKENFEIDYFVLME